MVLTFPFEYQLVKFNVLSDVLEGMVESIAPLIFEDASQYTLKLYSDSTGMYLGVAIVLVISFVVSLFWFWIEKKKDKPTIIGQFWFPLLLVGICYFLALQMSIYGCNKVFKYQFYDAHPNTLYTPIGFLTKDFLYWTSIGSSKLYNSVIGSMELLVAVLLVFKRTRPLASVLGLLISSYLVLINFAFDINVKIQSLFLVFLFGVISFTTLKKLYLLFFKGKSVILPQNQFLVFKRKSIGILIKGILISLILVESMYPYVRNNNFNGDELTKPPYYGAYKIENDVRYKRFFIHSDPYFIIQDHDDQFYSFPMELGSDVMVLHHQESTSALVLKVNDSLFSLKGDFFGYPMNIQARKLNIDRMPLYRDSFQWTIDGYKSD